MKKLLSAAMALVMGLSMGAPVLAEGTDGILTPDGTEIQMKKDIKLTNPETKNPAETFEFKVTEGVVTGPGTSEVDAPVIENFSIEFGQDIQEAFTNIIDLAKFDELGIYTYQIEETPGSTAGMSYDENTYRLQVTVRNDVEGNGFEKTVTLATLDGETVKKTDAFQNEFSAGSLVVNKEITGNFAQQDDQFEVTVTLTPDAAKTIKEGPIVVGGAVEGTTGTVTKDAETGVVTVTFTVTDNSEVTIANIPYNVSYVVSEDEGDYTATITDKDNGKIDAASQEVGIVNKLDQEIATGVNLDNLPYILVLALVGIGLISFTVRKRVQN